MAAQAEMSMKYAGNILLCRFPNMCLGRFLQTPRFNNTTTQSTASAQSIDSWIRKSPPGDSQLLELGQEEEGGGKKGGIFRGGSLLEHDDAADEGCPEGGTPGGGEGEEVGQLGRGDGASAGAGGGAEDDLGDEEYARSEEAHRRQEPSRPPHRLESSTPVAGGERERGRRRGDWDSLGVVGELGRRLNLLLPEKYLLNYLNDPYFFC